MWGSTFALSLYCSRVLAPRAAIRYLLAALITLICTVGLLHHHDERGEEVTCSVCATESNSPVARVQEVRPLAAGGRPPLYVVQAAILAIVRLVAPRFTPVPNPIVVLPDGPDLDAFCAPLLTRGPPALA